MKMSGINYSPTVQIKQGSVKGSVEENIDGGKYLSFSGIPYAQPPLGELRFKDPQPPLPWAGILDVSKESSKAIQFDEFTHELIGSEDCLHLNVAVNNLSGKKPVMVWIHGGGFMMGSGNRDFYSPDYLLKHDIVFVSMNYRLGIFGFLNMESEDCPGNQGLKDQVLALKWVQENIEAFGGDKSNVTIFGQSAGGASVHYHCLSPQSKGLFHKAIMQSGAFAAPWAHQASNKCKGFKIAASLGKNTFSSEKVVNFLRSLNPQDIMQAEQKLYPMNWLSLEFNFVTTIDSKCENPFLPKPPSELIKNYINLPLMIGYNSRECAALLAVEQESWYTRLNTEFDKILAADLKQDIDKVSKFSKETKGFYFKDPIITRKNRDAFINFKTDTLNTIPVQYVIDRQMQKTRFSTYVYRFSLNVQNCIAKTKYKVEYTEGAAHSDELSLLFHMPNLGIDNYIQKGSVDYLVMKRLTKMWTDFAKSGNPTPEIDDLVTEKWIPLKKDKKFYIEICDRLQMKENPDDESWKFWKPIVHEYQLI